MNTVIIINHILGGIKHKDSSLNEIKCIEKRHGGPYKQRKGRIRSGRPYRNEKQKEGWSKNNAINVSEKGGNNVTSINVI